MHHVNGRHDWRSIQIVCFKCHHLFNKIQVAQGKKPYGWITREAIEGELKLDERCTHEFVYDQTKKHSVWERCVKCDILIAIRY